MRRQPLLLWLTGLYLAVAGPPLAWSDEPPPAVLSADRLKARILEEQRKIRSFYVVYRTEPGAYPEPQHPPGAYLRRVVAAKAPDRMYYVNSHGFQGLDWQDDAARQHWYLTAQGWVGETPVNRTYISGKLGPKDELPGELAREFFFFATGLWLFDQHPAPRLEERPIVLRDVAASQAYRTVRPRQEKVDGRWCHVLEHEGWERLWIDTEHGCALLARETEYGTPPALTQRLEAGGHREVAPGVWLPSWLRNIQYNWRARSEEERKAAAVNVLHPVLEARANDVDDGLFEFRPPPGALDVSQESAPVQTQPGGLDHLDNVAAWIQRHRRVVPPPAFEVEDYLAGLPLLALIPICEVWLCMRGNPRAPARGQRGDVQKGAPS